MVYDPIHRQTVLFGGENSSNTALADTWVYNGTTWTQLSPATSPTARLWHSMAFDPGTGTVVLFGGCTDHTCAGYLGDTWIWNGTTWSNPTVPTPPTARRSAAMAYLNTSVNAGLILFGGATSIGAQSDMYRWNGTTWSSLFYPGPPPAREAASMTYDPIAARLVLFGGNNGSSSLFQDTWEFSGTSWQNPTLSSQPTPRRFQGQVYDPVRQVTVLFGGRDSSGSGLSDTWLWNGAAWALETTATTPAGRYALNLAYDTQHADTVMFGGTTSAGDVAETWTLGYIYTSGWMQMGPQGGAPPSRYFAAAANDGSTVYLFGGLDSTGTPLSDTYKFHTGVEYGQVTGGTTPPARASAAMVWSPPDGAFLMFGGGSGSGGATPLGDTWLLNESGAWAPPNLPPGAVSPSSRLGHAMVYDPINKQTMLFGGYNAGVQGDTWVWNSAGWSHVDPSSFPTARQYPAMVYDGARSQTLLFGGMGNTTAALNNETWIWNGGNWTQLSPAASPSPRYGAQLVFDSTHGTVLLFGGETATGRSTELWQWDGLNWTSITPSSGPSGTYGAAATYVNSTQQFFMFGGNNVAEGVSSETWMWASPYAYATLITGFSGQSYFDAISPGGGDGTYTLTELGLPFTFESGGLSMSSSGVVTGTDTIQAGQSPIGIGVTISDTQGQKTYVPLTLITDAPIVFSPNPPRDATVGATYTYPIPTPTGGTPSFHYSLDPSSSLSWLSINSSTQQITGTCPATTTGTFSINTFDSLNGTVTAGPFTLNCNPAPLLTTTNPATLPGGTEGTSYSVQLTTNAIYDAPGAAPFSFTAPPNSLPQGLSLSSTGLISGVPSAVTSTPFTVKFADRWGATTSTQFTINVNAAPSITTTTLPDGFTSSNYSTTLQVSGGTAPFTWSLGSNTLPSTLTLNSSGVLSGVPQAPGTFTLSAKVTDSNNVQATTAAPLQVTILNGLSISTIQLANGNLNVPYPANQAIGAVGGLPPYTFGATGLPPGLSFNTCISSNTPSCAITGTPTTAGIYNPTFTLSDSANNQTSAGLSITVAAPGTYTEDWIQLNPAVVPASRDSGVMFYDSVHNQTVMFGGNSGFGIANDTNIWNGTNWTPVAVNPSLSARSGAAAAFDATATHGVGVMFGGQQGSGTLSETWIWDGSAMTWTQATPANSPPQLANAMMAWDGYHIVLFGGRDNSFTDRNDTWIWDGTNWTNVTPANSPGARDSGGMVYDSANNKVVLFGGQTGSNPLSDTWLWNGANKTWTSVTPANAPSAREGHSMAYDSLHSQTIVFGGVAPIAEGDVSETWAWNGTTWNQLTTPHNPIARDSAQIAYDTLHSQVVLFGGSVPLFEGDASDTWILEGPVVPVPNLTLPAGTVGAPYSASVPLQTQGGISQFTYLAPTPPPGIHLNSATGAFSGAPTTAGPYTVPVTIQDGWGVSIVPPFSVTINTAATLTLAPNTLPNATENNNNYSEQLSATGGVTPYHFAVANLPTGLNLNSFNQIVGPCTALATSSTVMLSVKDSATPTQNVATVGPLTVTCNAPPSITPSSLPNGFVNVPYTATLQMSGGTLPIQSWSLAANTLGFVLSPTGVLTGTATSPTTATLTVTVKDFWGAVATLPYTLNIESALTITTSSLPPGTQGAAYASGVSLAASGGTGPNTYTFGVTTGLPLGLHIDSGTGAITGTPTGSGVYQPTFTVTDQTPQTVTKQIAIEIASNTGNPNWTNLNPPLAPSARDSYAMAYDPVRKVTVLHGGSGSGETWTFAFPSTWTKQTATPSPSLAQTGATMAWMPAMNNIVLFGGSLNGVLNNQTWTWNGTAWTQVFPAHNPPARYFQGMASDPTHNQIVMFGGSTGTGPGNAVSDTWVWNGVDWTQKSPSTVPPALYAPMMAQGPTGPVLFGGENTSSQQTAQTYVWDGSNWNLQTTLVAPSARDAGGLVFDSGLQVTKLFGGFDGTNHLQDTWQWNGSAWTLLAPAAMPPARDSIGLAYDSTYAQTILFGGYAAPAPDLGDTWTLGFPVVTNTTLPPEAAGAAYNATIPIIGGTPPYSISQTGTPQSLPNGLNLNATTGQITGATQTVGIYSIGVVIGDSQTASTSPPIALSLTVSPSGSLLISPSTLPDATASTNYSVQLSATGGVLPYHFAAANLPAGLQLNSSNQIAGQCTAGTTNASFSVTDSAVPSPATSAVTGLTVRCNAAPSITPSSLPTGIVNVPYTATLLMSGGTSPVTLWTLGANTLPSGFQLSSTGVLTGTATAAATATLNVSVSDFWGAIGTKTYTLIFYPVLTIGTISLPNGTAGTAYQSGVAITPSGGTGSATYGFSATGLPSGFAIDPASGIISGNTTQTGLFTPTFKVTDHDAQIASKQINLTIVTGSGLTILSPTTLPAGTTGQPYSYTLQWTGGVLPASVTSTALPSWLTLNSTTGVLTGTPTAGGAYTFPITVTDSQTPTPNSVPQTETIVVNAPTITTPSPLPSASIGIAYSTTLTAGSGQSPYTWVSTNLPSWLSLSSAGKLTGTPPSGTPASVSFNVKVTDSRGAYNSGSLTLPVLGPASLLFQTTSPLPPATLNVPYTATVQVAGGNGVFTLAASGLPSWLHFNATTGGLSGTPPTAGPVTFGITLSDNVNQSLTESFTLPVNAALTLGTPSSLPPATAGLPYAETLTASGGSGTYTWSAADLPSWLSLSAAGVFSGTPTQAGSLSFRVTVQDSQSHSLNNTYTLQVLSALTILTGSPLPPATLNFPYTATFAAAGGAGGYQWSATGLPSGFTLSPAGVLLGTPATATTISFSAKVTDSLNASATLNVTIAVNATPAVSSTPLPPAVVGVPYRANLTASGGAPGYTFSATGLPTWLTLTQAGYLSGTPTSSGTVTFQATVTDSLQATGAAPVSIVVNPSLSISTTSLPPAAVNVAYSTTLTAAGGIGPYTWSATNLPKGLAISLAGVLSGTIAQSGSYPFQVTVWDSQTSIASQNYTLLVSTGSALSFVTQSLNSCVPGALCSNQIVATGGVPPYTFSVPSTANLNGLSLSSAGLLSGTPQSTGSIAVPVILRDQQTTITQTFTQPVNGNLFVTTGSLPGGTVGVSYGTALRASGGKPPYTWSLASGTLPAGLTLDAQGGNIYGTPSAAGTATFSAQVTDAYQTSPPQPLSIVIQPPITVTPLLISSPSLLAFGIVGQAYSQTLAAMGGNGPYTWSVTSGSLPAGLGLASTGAITGTPSAAQTGNFTATVKDSSGNALSSPFTILVAPPGSVTLITPNPLPNGAVGVQYDYPIQVLGGTPPYFFSITSGQVPPGLTFDATNGTITGTPTQQGSFGLVLNVTDSGTPGSTTGGSLPVSTTAKSPTAKSPTAKQAVQTNVTTNYTIQIVGVGGYQITTAPNLPTGTLGLSYSTTFAASGGAAPYQWQLVTGSLPTGLALSSTGSITGTPTQSGQTSLVVKATDTTGATATGAFLLQIVNPRVPFINPFPPLSPGTVGQLYQTAFNGVGGQTPYTWSIATGKLPAGVSLNAQTGILSGTPTQSGNFPLTVEITDANQVTTTQTFTLRVNSPALQITPATIPAGIANVAYTEGLNVVGGTAPYNWSLTAGALLNGFAIDPASGTITGTPTAAGSFQFTISVTDSNFGIAMQTYQFTVQSSTVSIATTSAPSTTAGGSYDFGLQASNGTAPFTWTLVSGTLPPGIQLLSAVGLLVGTPTTAGSYTFTVQVTDSTNTTAQATFTIVVSPAPLTIVTASLPGGSIGTAYSQTVQFSGGTGAITWSVTTGALPAGLSLGSTTGIVSGTPSAPGSFIFTVQAVDSTGVKTQQTFTVVIPGPPALPAITLSGLPATSKPGDQPVVTIALASPYPLPLTVTATLSLTPNLGNPTDLMFASNGLRTTQITIPANTTTATLPFQTGTLPGAIQVTLAFSAAGVNVTPPVPPSVTTTIAATVPTIDSVAVTTVTGGIQVTVVGTSTTLDMKTATFTFTPAAGATLQNTTVSVDVSSTFAAWYQSTASLKTGSQFSLSMPFTISGNVSSIASVSVTLTNSVGASAAVSAVVP